MTIECCNTKNSIDGAMKCDCHGCNAIIDNVRDMVNQKHYSEKPDFGDSIPEVNHLKQFIHCKKCVKEIPNDTSPQEWARHEVGWTIWGFQVWCLRHNVNVLHVDFQGAKHPSSLDKLPETKEERKQHKIATARYKKAKRKKGYLTQDDDDWNNHVEECGMCSNDEKSDDEWKEKNK